MKDIGTRNKDTQRSNTIKFGIVLLRFTLLAPVALSPQDCKMTSQMQQAKWYQIAKFVVIVYKWFLLNVVEDHLRRCPPANDVSFINKPGRIFKAKTESRTSVTESIVNDFDSSHSR